MAMAKFTVDTTAKLFIVKPGVTAFDVKVDFYSDAKEHWIAGGAAFGFDFPIRTIGGDSIGGSLFAGDLYFLRDGWKIRPDEVNHTLNVTGNLFLDEGEVGGLFVPTLGGYTVLVNMRNSNLVQTVGLEGLGTQLTDIDARIPSSLVGGKMDSTLAADERDGIAQALLALANGVEDGFTLRRTLRIIAAAVAGRTSGGPAGFVARNLGDTQNQVDGAADADGNRTVSSYGS